MLNYIILGFLTEHDMTGYDIKQTISHSTSNFYDASYGSIYPMLKKLEAEALITSREEVEAGKFRVIYTITDKGRGAFEQWLHEPVSLKRATHLHLVKLFFYDRLPKQEALALIQQFKETVEAERVKLQTLRPHLQGKASFFQMQTLDYGTDFYQFLINWLDALPARLAQAEAKKETI